MAVAEILVFPSTPEYVADRAEYKGALDILLGTKGHIKSYHGIQIEDGVTGYLVALWETLEDHKNLMTAPTYPALIDSIKAVIAGPFDMQHVPFNGDPDAALTAPTTEIATLILKSGKSKDDLGLVLNDLCNELDKAKGGPPSSKWGESIEKPGTFVLVIGWESPEVHLETVKADVFKSIVSRIDELVDGSFSHAKLVKH